MTTPTEPATGRQLREALVDAPRLDDDFEDDIAAALALLTPTSDQADVERLHVS